MSELDEKLNALLSDPGSMAQIMQLAQQLSGSMGGDTAQPAAASAAASPPPPHPRRWAASTRRLSPDTCRSCRS